MSIIEEFDAYLAEENSNRVGSYAMRTVENFVQWAKMRGYLLDVQQPAMSKTDMAIVRVEYIVARRRA